MGLNWKDLVSTIGTGLLVYLYYANLKGINLPIITSTRGAIAVIFFGGLAICAFGSRMANGFSGPMTMTLAGIGGLAMILAIIGLITGNKFFLTSLIYVTLLLWTASTIRHIAAK